MSESLETVFPNQYTDQSISQKSKNKSSCQSNSLHMTVYEDECSPRASNNSSQTMEIEQPEHINQTTDTLENSDPCSSDYDDKCK